MKVTDRQTALPEIAAPAPAGVHAARHEQIQEFEEAVEAVGWQATLVGDGGASGGGGVAGERAACADVRA